MLKAVERSKNPSWRFISESDSIQYWKKITTEKRSSTKKNIFGKWYLKHFSLSFVCRCTKSTRKYRDGSPFPMSTTEIEFVLLFVSFRLIHIFFTQQMNRVHHHTHHSAYCSLISEYTFSTNLLRSLHRFTIQSIIHCAWLMAAHFTVLAQKLPQTTR